MTRGRFDGSDYDPELDDQRLSTQYGRIFNLMKDGAWRTLQEISAVTGDSVASISAQLRHMRKPRFGSHLVEKERSGDPKLGRFIYRLIVNTGQPRCLRYAAIAGKPAPHNIYCPVCKKMVRCTGDTL